MATSRAKNCLVVLYPDDKICNTQNFTYINNENVGNANLESLASQVMKMELQELTTTSSEIENQLFGSCEFLEDNCRVLYHDEVNFHKHDNHFRYTFVKGGNTIDILV